MGRSRNASRKSLLFQETILGCQRKCEDALQALLLIGVRPPVRRLSAKALVQIIAKGDSISIYSRASSLQGLLLESRKLDSVGYIGLANCLGALYCSFGQKLTSGLPETSNIVVKLMKFPEVSVRQAALQLLQDALRGLGGGGSLSAYAEALRVVLRTGATDKSALVKTAAAACLHAFALSGAPGIGVGGLESCCALCVKALEDSSESVRNAYALALGSFLALGLNPDAQVQSHRRVPSGPAKTIEGGIDKHLIVPFMRASGPLHREVRVGIAMAWVAFLQGMHFTYGHSDLELQNYALQAMSMLTFNSKLQSDVHRQACVIYILRVGVVEVMSEPAQKEFLTLLTKQLSSADTGSSMLVVILRTISHLLTVLGEVPTVAREALENLLVVTLSNSIMAVRVETALTIRALTEVDPSCANNLMSFGVTTMRALRETVAIERGDRLKHELDSLHGQALMLGAILAASSKLPLGVPSRLPAAVLELAKRLVLENRRNLSTVGMEKEAGWVLIAAIVSSMTKEEMEEQEFDIIALWTVPFGGNSEARLRQAEANLGAEICGWTVAVEALTAFIKSYVVPNLSTRKEGILLQPILGYLSGALTYISSTTLQQVTSEFKHSVSAFLMRTLMAYHALPDPFCYKSDHNALLSICTAPFRDPALWGESSSLRQLLDYRDASLGPWIPGRDSFEDELRVFEGGLDGPLPCVWENDISAFPQPLSVSLLLLNQKLLCFGSIFVTQREAKKLQLLDIIEGSMKVSKKQSFYEANATNVCVALLAAVKEALRLRSSEHEPEVYKRLQLIFQGLLAEETTTLAQRRAAAEGLGILARLGDDVFAARLMRTLLADATSVLDISSRGSIAFALGCIHRSKGGMALSVLVPATVQILCTMVRDSKALLHKWALHGLWLTTEAAGLAFVPHVQATMALVMDALLCEEHTSPDLQQSLGRLINAIVAVIGPELSPGSSFFSRCKSVVAEIAFGEDPAALLESVLFTQQLVLFAPQAVSFHTHVQTLTPTLWSKQPSLRQAAVSTLRHLAERDPISMIDERIEEKLFAMLDTETNGGIIKLVRLTLLCLLEAACPMYASRWLFLCKKVVLATSSTISAGNNSGVVFGASQTAPKASNSFGGDEEEMISRVDGEGISQHGSEAVESKLKEGDQLPRYSTRLFAAECLSRLPYAVGEDNRHFNLVLAREDADFRAGSNCRGDWLVNHLGQLVALAYQVATGVFESLRPKGVMLLVTIIRKFGMYEDPDFNGHLLLEQYQAQFVSAVRTALSMNAGPLLLDAGLQLAAMLITSGISNGDQAVFLRVVALMSNLLVNFEELQFPPYAEWVGCKVQVSLLYAYASVKRYAYNCMIEASKSMKEGLALMMLVASESIKLRELWLGLLRDVAVLQMYPIYQLQARYSPFLGGLLLPAVTAVIQPLLDEVWPVVFEALTMDTREKMSPAGKNMELTDESSTGLGNDPTFGCQTMPLTLVEFNQLWLLSFSVLCQRNKQRRSTPSTPMEFHASSFKSVHSGSMPDSSAAIAFQGIHYLCEEGLKHSGLLTTELSEELFQVLICIRFKSQITASKYIMPILNQVVKSSPGDYFVKEEWVSSLIEACVYHGRQLICSELVERDSEADNTVCITFETLEILAKRSSERLSQLLPIILSLVSNFVLFSAAKESSLSMALNVVVAIMTMIIGSADQQLFVVVSIAQTVVETVKSLIANGIRDEGIDQPVVADNVYKLSVILDLSVRVAQTVMENGLSRQHRDLIVDCCIDCFRLTLTASHIETQLVGLQTLRMVAQTAIANRKHGSSYELALLLMKELGVAIVTFVYMLMKSPLTSKAAISIGERLKLVLLLHSLIEGDEQQTEAMQILLPAIICAASPDTQTDAQIAAGLKVVAMKLVTHLASQANLALAFKTVLSHMPIHLRQNLQEIIRASIAHQRTTADPAPAFPVTAQKLVIPASFTATISSEAPAYSSSSQRESISNEREDGDDDDDEDWDDFQSQPLESAPESGFNAFDAKEIAAGCSSQSEGAIESHQEEFHDLKNSSDMSIGPFDDEGEDDEDFDSFQGVSNGGES
ncbi:hypothetical protein GOP47_0023051 [Adiantum capillus-veneris]|uniref:HEAT repeat-containing protein 5B n=1 Tax=Adiantum capillus-veneris TaxID=13818 RepID=A0A9D4Z6K6_ADICA|nr:hypothetical protein GOP47_0023051 [Adiantum capillus-veneris]